MNPTNVGCIREFYITFCVIYQYEFERRQLKLGFGVSADIVRSDNLFVKIKCLKSAVNM